MNSGSYIVFVAVAFVAAAVFTTTSVAAEGTVTPRRPVAGKPHPALSKESCEAVDRDRLDEGSGVTLLQTAARSLLDANQSERPRSNKGGRAQLLQALQGAFHTTDQSTPPTLNAGTSDHTSTIFMGSKNGEAINARPPGNAQHDPFPEIYDPCASGRGPCPTDNLFIAPSSVVVELRGHDGGNPQDTRTGLKTGGDTSTLLQKLVTRESLHQSHEKDQLRADQGANNDESANINQHFVLPLHGKPKEQQSPNSIWKESDKATSQKRAQTDTSEGLEEASQQLVQQQIQTGSQHLEQQIATTKKEIEQLMWPSLPGNEQRHTSPVEQEFPPTKQHRSTTMERLKDSFLSSPIELPLPRASQHGLDKGAELIHAKSQPLKELSSLPESVQGQRELIMSSIAALPEDEGSTLEATRAGSNEGDVFLHDIGFLHAALAAAEQAPNISNVSNATNSTNSSNVSAAAYSAAAAAAALENRGQLFSTFPIVLFILLVTLATIPLLKTQATELSPIAPFFAEYLGTFALVTTVGCCSACGSSVWNAVAIGCVLMIMIYATGPVSGGNLNPAVSLSLSLCKKLPHSVMLYWAAQILGAISASCFVRALFPSESFSFGPVAPFQWYHACIVEVIYTFMICFVVNNCAASRRNNSPEDRNQFFALAIGFVIVAGGYAAGDISGACFNPAVSIGMDIVDFGDGFHWCFLWCAAQALGALLASLVFFRLRPEDYLRDVDMAAAAIAAGSPDYVPSLGIRCFSECLGVFILVFTVGLNVTLKSPATALSAAAALMCMIYSLGDVSGGHFNPSVTLAVVLSQRNKCRPGDGMLYCIMQMIGGVLAGLLYAWFHSVGPYRDSTFGLEPGISRLTGDAYTLVVAAVAECFYTFLLAYIVLATATTTPPESQRTKQNNYFALCIGACVAVGGFAIGSVSGGELNPAVSTGIVLATSVHSGLGVIPPVTNWIIFVIAELVGGIFAAGVFSLTHHREYEQSGTLVNASKYICEFVGTFVLVFTVGCVVIAGDKTWGVTSIGMSLMVMIYATGPISGGNLNPAVSLALALSSKLPWFEMLGYWIVQLFAGVFAGLASCMLLSPGVVIIGSVAPYAWYHGLAAEVMYTFMVCFVVNNCAASNRNNSKEDGNQFYALAIGFVIIAGGHAVGNISGANLNPAVSIGLDAGSLGASHGMCVAYAFAQLIGAFLAAVAFIALRPEDYQQGSASLRDYRPSMITRCTSEFIGVFMLVLTVGLNVTMNSPATAWSAAATLMCMIYSLGDVSGGHLNPAVTLAVLFCGRKKLSLVAGAYYIFWQMLAGLCAGVVFSAFHAVGPNKEITYALAPGKGYSMLQAGFAELVFTFLLAYTVLAVATTPPTGEQKTRSNFYFALCIGSAVTVGGNAIGAVSGGELNPAVSLGISIANLVHSGTPPPPMFENSIIFGLWELAGGLLAALAFHFTHASEYVLESLNGNSNASGVK